MQEAIDIESQIITESEFKPNKLETVMVEVVCQDCGNYFEICRTSYNGKILNPTKEGRCDKCAKIEIDQWERLKNETKIEDRLKKLDRLNPFRGDFKTDFKKLPDKEAARKAYAHDWTSNKGLWFHGVTGTAKSRVGWKCLEKAVSQGLSFFFIDGESIRKVASLSYEAEKDLKWFKNQCFCVDLLFFDDIGNESQMNLVEDIVWDVIKYRNESGKKLLITSQHTFETLETKFRSPERGQSIVRRIMESCVDIPFIR